MLLCGSAGPNMLPSHLFQGRSSKVELNWLTPWCWRGRRESFVNVSDPEAVLFQCCCFSDERFMIYRCCNSLFLQLLGHIQTHPSATRLIPPWSYLWIFKASPHPPSNPPLPPWICGTTAQHHCRKVLGISMQLCHWASADVSITLVSMETSSSPQFLPSVCISSVCFFSTRVSQTARERTVPLFPLFFCFPSFFSSLDFCGADRKRRPLRIWNDFCLSLADGSCSPGEPAVWATLTLAVSLDKPCTSQPTAFLLSGRTLLWATCVFQPQGLWTCVCGRVSVDLGLWISVGMPTRWLSPPPISSYLHSAQRQWSSVVVWFWSWLLSHIVSSQWRVCFWCFSLVNSWLWPSSPRYPGDFSVPSCSLVECLWVFVVVCSRSFDFSFALCTFFRPCGFLRENKSSVFSHATHFWVALLHVALQVKHSGTPWLWCPSHVNTTDGSSALWMINESNGLDLSLTHLPGVICSAQGEN